MKPTRKTHREIESSSSEEIESRQETEKQQQKKPKINQKQPSKEKDVRVAPNSTTEKSEPAVRESKRRETFQSQAKQEKTSGVKASHRRYETDIKRKHPELVLVEKAKAAGGHLDVRVSDANEAKVLAEVLKKNPSIRSLKLRCDLGGYASDIHENIAKLKDALRAGKSAPDSLDEHSFRQILNSCVHLRSLDVSGCRLKDASWIDLKDSLTNSSLQRLVLGDKDSLISDEFNQFLASLSNIANLHELIVKDTEAHVQIALAILEKSVTHPRLKSLKLSGVTGEFTEIEIGDLFKKLYIQKTITHLSLAGTRVKIPLVISDEILWDEIQATDYASAAESLEYLDLSGCGLSEKETSVLAAILQRCPALEGVMLDGNEVSAKTLASIRKTCERNINANPERRRLIAQQGAAAYDLLINNAAQKPDVWPEELSVVLVENTPVDVLVGLSRIIGENDEYRAKSRKAKQGNTES
jgi:hypothetical protein